MIVDTSALIAIIRDEPEAEEFSRLIVEADRPRISAVAYVEAGAVLDRAGDPVLARALDRLLEVSATEVEPVTAKHARIAREAFRDFGKGSGHPAALNFGDCFSYALASEAGEPLLFKGADFAETNLRPASGQP